MTDQKDCAKLEVAPNGKMTLRIFGVHVCVWDRTAGFPESEAEYIVRRINEKWQAATKYQEEAIKQAKVEVLKAKFMEMSDEIRSK